MTAWLSPDEAQALVLSLKVSSLAIAASLPFGIALAWVLARCRFPGHGLVNALVHLPLILPPVATGYLLLVTMGRKGPVGAFLDQQFGLVFAFRWTGAALAAAVMAFPFLVRAIRLAFEAVDPRLEAAAATLGARPVTVFFTVSLPLALPGVLAGAVTGFAKAMGEFGATITFVSNIPGQTQTLPTAIYTALAVPGGEGAALKLVAISIVIAFAAILLSEALARRVAAPDRRAAVIEVDLAHRFPGFTLEVAFTAPAGVTALFGASGAGKSSVALAVAGLWRPDRARIALGGRVLQDAAAFVPPRDRRLGVVFQEARLFPHMSVRRNLDYARRFGLAKAGPALEEVAALLGIAPLLDRGTAGLSGGERARVAIGRALLSDPAALILDEPFAALDAPRRAEILPYLETLRDRFDLPILYISHALGEVAQLAQTLVVLDQGRVVRAGPAVDVLSDPALVPVFGTGEAGAVIAGRVLAREADGLTRIATAGGPVFLPGRLPPPGAALKLRIRAQDVMLALSPPQGLSALNLLAVRVESLLPEGEAGMIVALRLGEERLLARITRRSAEALALAPGLEVQAILKTVALAGS